MMTEDQLEQETLIWLAELGYKVVNGLDIAPMATAQSVAVFSKWC
jgi:hypothetical protein